VATLGLGKEEIQRIVLAKLRVVYREWSIRNNVRPDRASIPVHSRSPS